jgi:competence protein ComEC
VALIFVSLAWLCGLYLGHVAAGGVSLAPGSGAPPPLEQAQPWLAALLALSALAALLARDDARTRLLCASLLFALLGVARALSLAPALDTLPAQPGQVTVTGTVATRPEPRDAAQLVILDVDGLRGADGWKGASARVLVRADRYQEWIYGDRVVARGELRPVAGSSGYWAEYLARQGIYRTLEYPQMQLVERLPSTHVRRLVDAARDRLDAVCASLLPEPHASLLAGILVGSRASMPPDFREALNVTSTSHIVAVSGFNVTVLAGAVILVALRFLSRRKATVVAILAVWVYAVLTGLPPSAARAAIMATMALAGTALGRGGDALSFLCFSGAVMAGLDPPLLYDLGFQLSFLATAGLVLLEPVLRGGLTRLPGWIAGSLSVTLAAQLAVLPVLVWNFQLLSIVSPLSNLLIAPVLPTLMGVGGITVLLGAIAQPLGELAAPVAWLQLTYLVETIRWTARLPGAALDTGGLGPLPVLVYYLLLLSISVWPMPEARTARASVAALLGRTPRWLVPGAAAALICLAGLALSARPDGPTHLYFIDVGHGDATLVRSAEGHQILIDGGPSPNAITNALGRRLGLMDRRLDAVVLTGYGEDRLAGMLEVVRRHPVDLVVQPASPPDNAPGRAWSALLRERGVAVRQAGPGQRLDLGNGSWLEVVWAPVDRWRGAEGEAELAVRLVHGSFSAVMMGDLSGATQAQLARGLPGCAEVLRLPRHGAAGSLDDRFLKAVSPRLAVVSVRAGNRLDHPAASTVQALGAASLLRTDEVGTVELVVDREGYKVFTER